MTRSPRRLALAAVTAGLAAVTLAGCGGAPVHAGAAATVGPDRISIGQLQGMVTRGLADPTAAQQLGANKPAFERQALARLINHQVLAEAARELGVTVTPGQVDARLAAFQRQAGGAQQLDQQAARSGIAAADLRQFVSDVVLNEAIGDRLTAGIPVPASQLQALYAKNIGQFDQVHVAHILVPTKAQADALLAQVRADPSRFAALAAQFSIDTASKAKGGDLGFAGRGQFVTAFDTAVFSAPPGSFLEVKTQFGYHVVHVIARRTTSLAQATPQLRRIALQQQRTQAVGKELTSVAQRMGVSVNPRFGQWDATKGTVVALPVDSHSLSSPGPVR